MSESHIHVLVVEDNDADIAYLQEILHSDGTSDFALTSAQSLQEAIGALKRQRFDLILLDLSLPDSAGVQTVRAMIKACSDIPIVVLTGLDDEEIAYKAVQNGANDYLIKWKIDHEFIVRSLRYTLERFRLQEELQVVRDQAENARNYQHYVLIGGTVASEQGPPALTAQELKEKYMPLYRELVIDYLRAYRLEEPRPILMVKKFASTLATAGFRARDIVRLHLQVLNEFSLRAMPKEEREFSNDARLVLLELMGHVMNIYAGDVQETVTAGSDC